MAKARSRAFRLGIVVALLGSAWLAGVRVPPVSAQVTEVRGGALGFVANVSILGGQAQTRGPEPTVELPAGGSANPVTATAPSARAVFGPATIFTAGAMEVSTQGTTSGGSVTSRSRVNTVNTSGAEVFTAGAVESTCTATAGGAPTASTTITGGRLQTDSGDDQDATTIPNHPAVTVDVPVNPAPNTVIEGHIHIGDVTDNFRYVFNEQIRNGDGTITVNAAHQYFLGPAATGDLIIGQSRCSVTGSAATTSTTAPGGTTTTAPGGTTTTAPGGTTTTAATATTTTVAATTTTAPATTTTAPAATTTTTGGPSTGVGGGAYGHYISLSLFGGAPSTRGPAPSVTLPEAGSATPVTASAPSADVRFGPAILFTSGALEVSTQGTPGGSVTSSATVNNLNTSEQEVLTAASVSSTCTASSSGATGSTTISAGRLRTSEGNPDADGDDTIVDLPANPAPNTSFEGTIEAVGDTFRYVFNEQIRNADGSITVNAAHQYLLGPTAVGELIIGQSRCGTPAVGSGGGGGGGTQTVASTGGGGLASTGAAVAVFTALSLLLVVGGSTTTYWIGGVKWRERIYRRMPWTGRRLLR